MGRFVTLKKKSGPKYGPEKSKVKNRAIFNQKETRPGCFFSF
jgi:hypothetical protein